MADTTSDGEEAAPRKVVFDVEVAEEVRALVEDEPGEADEAKLDEALASIEDAGPRVPADQQARAADGEAVALELTPEGAAALTTLIEDDRERNKNRLRRIGQRLGGKLRRARAKRRGRRRR